MLTEILWLLQGQHLTNTGTGINSAIGLVPKEAAAKSLQSCPILCDPIDGSPPGSPIPGILQARTLDWVAISFSNARKWKVKVKSLSHVQLLATPWTAAYQAPPSMGFSRQEYWSGVPLPSPPKEASLYLKIIMPSQDPLWQQIPKRVSWKEPYSHCSRMRRVPGSQVVYLVQNPVSWEWKC